MSKAGPRILITGSEGLIGAALRRALTLAGYSVVGLDVQSTDNEVGDIRTGEDVHRLIAGSRGVVHLAAVSRVVVAERDPAGCWSTNVDGTHTVVSAAVARCRWILFASSREVYGSVECLPVTEETPLAPVNIYGRSKVAGEQLIAEAAASGLPVGVARLSNVYGRTGDHADRVVPAFARAAASGRPLRVDGPNHTFDFTHLDDVVRGLVSMVARLEEGESLPPIQLVSEKPTTLGELASLSVRLAGTECAIVDGPERNYDVAHFYGCGERARRLLDWTPQVPLSEGLAQLIQDFRREALVEVEP